MFADLVATTREIYFPAPVRRIFGRVPKIGNDSFESPTGWLTNLVVTKKVLQQGSTMAMILHFWLSMPVGRLTS